ncbi:uncharacterized protein LOC124808469 isoform X1 [Hydra vulgaris]|uniref:uncharacterized protein LOC124808469 isoform X1 n=1 Tax=Hydra vulgaris TaxID=6087 RepID=UPI0032EA8F6C
METSANDASDQRFALILSELATLRAELNKDASSLPTDQGSSVISTPPAQEVVNNLSSSTISERTLAFCVIDVKNLTWDFFGVREFLLKKFNFFILVRSKSLL